MSEITLPPMQYARLGRSGLEVSRICLGMMSYGDPAWRPWVLPPEDSFRFVKRALDLGINFFDTANMYSNGASEQILGDALQRFSVPRDQVVIASKVYFPSVPDPKSNQHGLSRKAILHEVEGSLKRLGTDYIDLYQIHRFDNDVPIEETLSTLNDLVRCGKVRYIGASSMYSWQFQRMLDVSERNGWAKFITMQNHYNLVYREEEREMMPLCVDQGIGVIPWSPLARGFLCRNDRAAGAAAVKTERHKTDALAPKYYSREDDLDIQSLVSDLATRKGVSMAAVATAWLLQKKGVTGPIIGATKMPHLEEAVSALAVRLTEDEVKSLEEPYKPHPVLGNLS